MVNRRGGRLARLGSLVVSAGIIAGPPPTWGIPRTLELLGVATQPPVHLPANLAVSPDGAHVYVTSSIDNALNVFTRNAMTGALELVLSYVDGIGTSHGLSGANDVELSGDGAYLYVTASLDNSVSVYARDAGTGALTFLQAWVNGIGGVDGIAQASALALSPDGAHVYVASDLDNRIAIFTRNALTGQLTFVAVTPLGVFGPRALTFSPDGAHLYVPNGFQSLAVLSRNAGTGALTPVEVEMDGVGGADGLQGASSAAVSPDGAQVYVTGSSERALAVFARNAGTGALTFVEVQRETVGGVNGLDGSRSVTLSPDGAYVYVLGPGDQDIVIFGRNAGTGALTYLGAFGGTTGLISTYFATMSPDAAQLYVLSVGFGAAAVVTFARDAVTGGLSLADVDKVVGAQARIVVSPDGTSVYTTEGSYPGDDGVAIYSRTPGTGALDFESSVMNGVDGAEGLFRAWGLAISPDGASVYVTALNDNAVTAFARDAGTGALTFIEAKRNGVGGVDGIFFPIAVTVSPDGKNVYATGDATVAVFSRELSTGALTFLEVERDGVAGVDGLSGASDLALSPDGAYLYVTGFSESAVAVFARNGATGALTFVEALFDGAAGGDHLRFAQRLALSPDGAHVYVAGSGDDAVTLFDRNPVTGALTFVESTVNGVDGVDGLDLPSNVSLTPDGELVYVSSIPSSSDATILVFARDAVSGRLAFVEREAGVSGFSPVTVSPDGAHVYASNGAAKPIILAPGFAGCGPTPLAGCRTASRGRLRLSAKRGKRFTWTWLNGQETDLLAFGFPPGSTHYALCAYDESGPPALALRSLAPAAGVCVFSPLKTCWRQVAAGYDYRDPSRTPEGALEMKLRTGVDGSARVIMRGSGEHVGLPVLPLGLPVRVQLQASNGECWEATYSAAQVNTSTGFVARPD
jgi:6-phosphogluconolactonase (cycloisomerase 2 family)